MKKLLIILISILLTGCYNYHELSDLAIVTGIGLDSINDNYQISLLIVNANNNEDSKNTPILITGYGKNINLAYEDAITKVSKDLYLGHLSLILIDEQISKNNLLDVVDSFVRDPKTVKKIKIAISKDNKSNEILKTISPLDAFPQENIISNINNSLETIGISHNVYLSNIIYNTVNYGLDNVIPMISLDVNSTESNDSKKEVKNNINIKVDNIALFSDNKLVGYLDKTQSKIFNILTNKATTVLITKENNDKYDVFKLTNSKTKIKLKDNTYNINVKSNAILLETSNNINSQNKELTENLKKEIEEEVTNIINETLKYAYNLNSDILGLGNILYKKNYKKFLETKDDYKKKIKYKINVDINVNEIGTLERKLNEKN